MAGILQYITLQDPLVKAKPRHMAYYEFGEQANPDVIMCVHGLSRNGQDFEFLATSLATRYRVICPDMAGRGNSDWLTQSSDYNYITYLTDIVALLVRLKLSQVDWVGTSMGGIIGMMLAAKQPNIIKRMVLNDIGATVSAEGLKRIIGYVGTSGIFANKDDAFAYLKSVFSSFGITSEKEWQQMFDTSFTILPDGSYAPKYDPAISIPFHAAASGENAITDIDLSCFWNTITCPALVIRGGVSDILSHQTATDMCNGRMNVSLVELPGIGHAPALLSDDQIKIITDWLDIRS